MRRFLFRLSMLVALTVLLVTGCKSDKATVERLETKRDHVKAMLIERASAGADISPYMERMKQAGIHFKRSEVSQGEAIMDAIARELEAGREDIARAAPDSEFGSPRRVTIKGYDETQGAMEPFISRDGRLLLFNSQGRDGTPPDLHYAEWVDDLIFRYRGRISGANSDTVDGAPSMDRNNRLYFISPRDYGKRFATIHNAQFNDGAIDSPRLVEGDVSPGKPGMLNMDAEISADGRTLYYSVNEWNTEHNLPRTSDIRVARLSGGRFETLPNSAAIFRAVNSQDLDYAPALSADEREIFFTRARFTFSGGKLALAQTRIMVARRDTTGKPFGTPRPITSITGFVEGPTITPNGRNVYFHRRDGDRFHLYTVTRR